MARAIAGINVDTELVALSVDVGAEFLDAAGEDVWVCLQAAFCVAEPSLPAVIDVDVLIPCRGDACRLVQPRDVAQNSLVDCTMVMIPGCTRQISSPDTSFQCGHSEMLRACITNTQ